MSVPPPPPGWTGPDETGHYSRPLTERESELLHRHTEALRRQHDMHVWWLNEDKRRMAAVAVVGFAAFFLLGFVVGRLL